eukprot:14479562-Alexandrium_andersonii.AAC.1
MGQSAIILEEFGKHEIENAEREQATCQQDLHHGVHIDGAHLANLQGDYEEYGAKPGALQEAAQGLATAAEAVATASGAAAAAPAAADG